MITLAITRPKSESPLASSLEAWGARVHRIPTIERRSLLSPAKLRDLWEGLGSFHWVLLTSPHAVRVLFGSTGAENENLVAGSVGRRMEEDGGPRWAVVGEATGRTLESFGVKVDLMPSQFTAESLVSALGDVEDVRILLPRSRIGDPLWVEALRERGALVEDLALYDTIQRKLKPLEWQLLEKADGLVFASGSALRSLLSQGVERRRILPRPDQAAFCIGPSTARVARDFGVEVTAVASPHTAEGLLKVITEHFSSLRED